MKSNLKKLTEDMEEAERKIGKPQFDPSKFKVEGKDVFGTEKIEKAVKEKKWR